jgi:hypothetical protein
MEKSHGESNTDNIIIIIIIIIIEFLSSSPLSPFMLDDRIHVG